MSKLSIIDRLRQVINRCKIVFRVLHLELQELLVIVVFDSTRHEYELVNGDIMNVPFIEELIQVLACIAFDYFSYILLHGIVPM